MPRIKLIVTGDMEKLALHKSLRRFFPRALNGQEVIWDDPRKLHCATTYRLLNNGKLSAPMKYLAQAMFAEAFTGKTVGPADLVIAIDDVEIGNIAQENIIAEHFRAAVEHTFQEKQYSRMAETRYRNMLRSNCSFHLFRPMVESYLFGDANALQIVGVQASPQLVYPDVEEFETNDPSWLPTCRIENAKRHQATPWWQHECHPKHYLEHLAERSQVFYEETNHGKNALENIAWERVHTCQSDTPFLRSLFEDIADWFGITNPIGTGNTSPHFYPAKTVNRNHLVLRNM